MPIVGRGPRWDEEADDLLQELYAISVPGPQFAAGKFFMYPHDRDRVLLFAQACGVSYERDQVSLIENPEYDRLGNWLGDAAATAMDWRSYPEEAKVLAITETAVTAR